MQALTIEMMEKEKLLSDLTPLLSGISLSQRSISDYVTNILLTITDDSTVNSEFLTRHANILKSMDGNLSFEIKNKVDEFKKNYKPVDQTQQNQQTQQTQQTGDDALTRIEKTLATIAEENRLLKEKIENQEKGKTQAELRAKVVEKMKSSSANNDYIINNALRDYTFDGTKTIDELATSCIAIYDNEYKKAYGEGAVPRNGSTGADDGKKELESFVARMTASGKLPKTN